MKVKFNILYGAILVLASCSCLQSCQDDELNGVEVRPDRNALIVQGRYLTARSEDAATFAEDTESPKPFKEGTPYRLLAFTKQYDEANPKNETPARTPRFNKVAWEGLTMGAGNNLLHYINISGDPCKLFGFSALDGEDGNPDGRVSIDFYGFTYGDSLKCTPPMDYIALDGLAGETTPDAGALQSLKRTEKVSMADGELVELKDLMRGVLLNQNIATAGIAAEDQPLAIASAQSMTQSVISFRHCFSKLRIMVSQQEDKEHLDAEGAPLRSFPDLCIEKIEVTGTYAEGSVNLYDGLVELKGGRCNRTLQFNKGFDKEVKTYNSDVGSMIIYPSDGNDLANANLKDGYDIGLNITVKSTVCADIENMLRSTESVGADGNPVIAEETVEGRTWYKGTIRKPNIVNYYDTTSANATLHFKQNTSYLLIIEFKKNDVRIISVIPQIEEWLPGENPDAADGEHWQEQALGHPQMFDNIVWSDRNLGADHYDPLGEDFEATIGYFYQSGRNIPYYPFDSKQYYDENTGAFTGHPDPTQKKGSRLSNVESYIETRYRFYPMVDEAILNMKHQMSGWGTQSGANGTDRTWIMSYDAKPQMFIPEEKPTDDYFDYMRSISQTESGLSKNSTSTSKFDTEWSRGQQRQPVSGLWMIPSSRDFMAIFPTTPHAGNITFRAGGWNGSPMGWGSEENDMDAQYKVLRVTVPYYKKEMDEPTRRSPAYRRAWNTLKDNEDDGTTCCEAYTNSGPDGNAGFEPDGDPEDGYASIYVISREDGHVYGLPEDVGDKAYHIKEWGTIYAIKRAYTPLAYRMRWRVLCAGTFGKRKSPGLYVEICRYRCKPDARMDEETYKTYDWDHPAARLYFPICGLGDWTGNYINFGTECQYATSDPIDENGMTSALQIKITGHDDYNAYIAVIRGNKINRDFGKQIRPIMVGEGGN